VADSDSGAVPTLDTLPDEATTEYLLSEDQAFVILWFPRPPAAFRVLSDGTLYRLRALSMLSPAIRPVSRETWFRVVRDEIIEWPVLRPCPRLEPAPSAPRARRRTFPRPVRRAR
jgi:hypothetical protein